MISILHDNRIMGSVAAAILARSYRRAGADVRVEFTGRGVSTRAFWDNPTRGIAGTDPDRLVLCGVTFDEARPERCEEVLAKLRSRRDVEIWTHRWPDGYSRLRPSVGIYVPQYDFYTSWRERITEAELSLFRLAQTVYQDLPPATIDDSRQKAADGLALQFDLHGAQLFERLLEDDLDALIRDLVEVAERRPMAPGAATAMTDVYTVTPVLSFKLDDSSFGHEERYIAQFARSMQVDNRCIAVATRASRRQPGVYVTRPLATGDEPSIEWLLEGQHGRELSAAMPDQRWFGPQDARHTKLPKETPLWRVLEIKDAAVAFASRAMNVLHGGRRPPSGLARYMHTLASHALESVDLLRSHTGSAPSVEFDPGRMQILLDSSDRTGARRATLLLHLNVASLDSAAFLFADNAYNLQKIERLLDGALAGLQASSRSFLGGVVAPQRLRVDVHLSESIDLGRLPDAIARPSTRSIPVELAYERKIILKNSRIDKALTKMRVGSLVVLSESELIGPSVPYALFLSELCRAVKQVRLPRRGQQARPFAVLDLFSGSGVATRSLTQEIPGVHVLAVDLMIRGEHVDVVDLPNVTWLNADARAVVGAAGLVDGRFDVCGMDPPHALLFDLVFATGGGPSLLESVAARASWLAMYVGHETQLGRRSTLDLLISSHYRKTSWFMIGQEVVVVAGPESDCELHFEQILADMQEPARGRLGAAGWSLDALP